MNIILTLSALVAVVLADAGAYQTSYYPSEPATIDTHADLKVVNGHNATRGQIPYQISLQVNQGGRPIFHYCGGSIIGKHWITTAAHCVSNLTADIFQIAAGILLLTDTNVTGQQTIPVAEIIVHELYNYTLPSNDIALLRLDEELIYNDNVQPIAIPPSNYHAEGDVVLSGWGITSSITKEEPNNLQYVDVPIVENDECLKFLDSHDTDHLYFDSEQNICSGSRNGGEAACVGDSGGPLVQNGKMVGIASWGMLICGDMNGPTVYTKVAAFASWIERTTNGQVKPDQINM